MRKFILLFTVLFLISGCAKIYVNVKRLEKPDLNITNVKRIAVLDFEDRTYPGVGRSAANLLISNLLDQRYYQIIERSELSKILMEHKLNLTGLIEEKTVKEVGKILGVDAIIMGNVTTYNLSTNEYTEMVERWVGTGKYETKMIKYFWEKKAKPRKVEIKEKRLVPEERKNKRANVSVDYRMVNVETGEVIAAKRFSKTYEETFTQSIFSQMPTNNEILEDLLRRVTQKFLHTVSPYYVTRKKELVKGKDDITNRGIDYAKNGMWEAAIECWKKSEESAAHNNLGVAYEREGRYEEAEVEYGAALKIEPNNKTYIQNLSTSRLAYRGETIHYEKEKLEKKREFIVLEVYGENVYFDAGEDLVELGDKFNICETKQIRHPETGELIGVDRIPKAQIIVVKLFKKMAMGKVTEKTDYSYIEIKDVVVPIDEKE